MFHEFITLPKNAKDIINQRFGRLVALGPVINNSQGVSWLCQCDCGNQPVIVGKKLRNGHTRSCGCLAKELTSARTKTHGMTRQSIYKVWDAMIQRCTNPSDKGYPYYGGRGIFVCDEWRNSFESYHAYVSQLFHYNEKGYSLDRIDNSLGYQPGNVRYATMAEQGRNRRSNIVLSYNGKTQTITDWATETKISRGLLQWRFHHGWSVERILTTPVRQRRWHI